MLSIGSLQLASFNINHIYDASSNSLQHLANLLKQATFTAKAGLEQHVMTAFSEISTKAVDYATTFQSYSTIEKISVIALKVFIPLAVIFTVVWCIKKTASVNLFKSTNKPQNIVNQPLLPIKSQQSPPPQQKAPASPKPAKTPPPTPATLNPLARQLSPKTPLHEEVRSGSPNPVQKLFDADSIPKTEEASLTKSAPVSRASSPPKPPSASIGGAGIPQEEPSLKPPIGPKQKVREFLNPKNPKQKRFSTMGNPTPPRSRASSTGSNPPKKP